ARYAQSAAVDVFDNVLSQGEAQTGPLGHLAVLAHAIELLEHLYAILLAQADAGVFDFEDHLVVLHAATQGDGATLGRVLDGVREQIDRRLHHHVPIHEHAEIHRAEIG